MVGILKENPNIGDLKATKHVQHALVTLCPYGNKLLYPPHFQKRNLYIFSKILGSNDVESKEYEFNCYGDVAQFSLMP